MAFFGSFLFALFFLVTSFFFLSVDASPGRSVSRNITLDRACALSNAEDIIRAAFLDIAGYPQNLDPTAGESHLIFNIF
jgi:hypothetical protein